MDKFSEKNASQYGRHYNEEEFWHKLRHIAVPMGRKILYPALQLYYLLQAKDVPVRAKTIIIGALGYLILPIDIVPDFIPALGFTDDLTALMIALRTMSQNTTPEIKRLAHEQAERILKQ